jgi:hypothetical protein
MPSSVPPWTGWAAGRRPGKSTCHTGSRRARALGNAFQHFLSETGGLGVTFTEAANHEEGIRRVREATSSCHLEVTREGILLAKNDNIGFEAGLVRSLLTAFLERFNAAGAIADVSHGIRRFPGHHGPLCPKGGGVTCGTSCS